MSSKSEMEERPIMVRMPRSAPEVVLLVSLTFLVCAPIRADFRFLEPVADAGEVKAGTPLAHRFDFVNDGPDVVEITGLHASCGCLTPRLDRRVYQPGERGSLLLEVNTLSQPAGSHHWKVEVGTRGGQQAQEFVLSLTARVITEIIVQPTAMTVFAEAAVDHAILLTDLRPRPLTLTEVRSSSTSFKARLIDEYRDEAGHVVRKVKVAIGSDYPEGRHEEIVTLFTDDPTYRELKVPVTIIKQPRQRFRVSPNPVSLIGRAGQPVPARVLLIRDREGQAVVVDQVWADHPGIRATWAAGPGSMATVRISLDRAQLTAGTVQSALHISLSKPVPEVVTIPLTCTLE
jgi:hypothetical protein